MRNLCFFLSFLGMTGLLFTGMAVADDGGQPLQEYREVKGNLLKKQPFADANGRNMVILTHSGLYQSRPDPAEPDFICGNEDLYAYGYASDGVVKPTLVW